MKTYTFPGEYEKKSEEYAVSCGDNQIAVYSCDVSAVPFNQVWPGYQRDKKQTEKSAYVMFSADEEITLDIEPKRSFEKVTVRPLSRGIKPVIDKYYDLGYKKIIVVSHGGIIRRFTGKWKIDYCDIEQIEYNKNFEFIGWV